MEDVLDIYKQPYNPQEPVLCMDETTKQLTMEVIDPIPVCPGQPERYDTLYKRNGVATVFMFFEPLAGWRRVNVTESKTRVDWAWQIRNVLEKQYPAAEKVHFVKRQLLLSLTTIKIEV